MALVLKDRVKETTTTSGTGSITLSGAVQGYQGFSSIGEGNTTYYCIVGVTEWEVGIGTYSGGMLSRDTVLGSSANNTKVAFSSGTKDVFCTYAADKAISSDNFQLTGAITTASPNATVNVASLTANVSTTDGDVVLSPKGAGALLGKIPTATVDGGDKRGQYAVDWQLTRLFAVEVASGLKSVIAGGHSNKASNDYSAVGGGTTNYATGYISTVAGGLGNLSSGPYGAIGGGGGNLASSDASTVAGGDSNQSTGIASTVSGGSQNDATNSYASVIGGRQNAATGPYSIAGGYGNVASGDWSTAVGGDGNTSSSAYDAVIGGANNTANGSYSAVLGGTYGTTRGIAGYIVSAASYRPIQAKAGVSQTGVLVLGVQTTGNTATRLKSSLLSAGSTNQLILADNSALYFRGTVIANVTGAGNTKSWTFDGQIKRGANAASTTLTGSTVASPYGDAGASTWTVALAADTTNGGLAVTVTGQASTTIRWVCRLETTEVSY